jgi:hypothetical protein
MSMFGTSIHDPPGGVMPGGLADSILPRPRRVSLGGGRLRLSDHGLASVDLLCDPGSDAQAAAAIDWLRQELRRLYGWQPAAGGRAKAHLVVGVSGPGTPARVWVDRLKIQLPAQRESYVIRIFDDVLLLAASDGEGLLRGVSTLVQLFTLEGGDLYAAHADIVDWPDLPLRILIGWVREDPGAREIIDLAFRWKYNRVYFGVWNWSAGERLTEADRALVRYARERGVELMFQLSRLSFAESFDANRQDDAARIIAAYESAVEAGFRSFGILFDDQTLQGVEAELHLTLAIHGRLRELLGSGFELTFVPEVYWVPGELAGWPPQPERAEEFRVKHRAYLDAMGAGLPADVEVYIANNWNDFPPGYAAVQAREFNAPARRKPLFFENQLTNDYRRAIVLPFPVHNRPPELATVMGGYGLNLPMPYRAYTPSIITCGALAWNFEGYDPPFAWGAALLAVFGRGRAPQVLEALNGLNRLFVEWTSPHFPAASHYGSFRAKLKDDAITPAMVRGWQERLGKLKALFASALLEIGTGTDALCLYVEEMERLDLDMGLLLDYLETREDLRSADGEVRAARIDAWRARQGARRQALLTIQSRRAPPSARLRGLLVQPDGTDRIAEHKPAEIPSGWWLTYFYVPMRDDIDAILRLEEELLGAGTPG